MLLTTVNETYSIIELFSKLSHFFIAVRNKESAKENGSIDTALDVLSNHPEEESVTSAAIKTLKSFIRGIPSNEEYIRGLISGNGVLEPFSSKIFKAKDD